MPTRCDETLTATVYANSPRSCAVEGCDGIHRTDPVACGRTLETRRGSSTRLAGGDTETSPMPDSSGRDAMKKHVRGNASQGPPGRWSFQLMWGLLGLSILISLLLVAGGLPKLQGWLIAGLVLTIAGFLVLGVVWERRSGANRMWYRRTKKPPP